MMNCKHNLFAILFALLAVLVACDGGKDGPSQKLEQAIRNITNLEVVQTEIEKRVLSDAIAIVKKSALKGDLKSMYWMSEGRLLDASDPNYVSVKEGIAWLKKAAMKGYLDAYATLGLLYSAESEVKNSEMSYKWYFIGFYQKNTKDSSMTEMAKVEFLSESSIEALIKELGDEKVKQLEGEAKQWIKTHAAELD